MHEFDTRIHLASAKTLSPGCDFSAPATVFLLITLSSGLEIDKDPLQQAYCHV